MKFLKEDAIDKINLKITNLKNLGYDIEFLGFVNNLWEGNTTKLILHRNKHNITWESTTLDNFITSDGIFCPECSLINKTSLYESICYKEIKNNYPEINVLRQYRIQVDTNLSINKSNLILVDFYIKSLNTIIEYGGEQHYH